MSPSLRAVSLSLALVAGALTGCKSTSALISEGDRLRSQKKNEEALERYREALERSDIGGSERERTVRATGEVLLEKGDLSGAEASFNRLPATSGARSWLLGRVALARGDRDHAEALEREAFARGERGACAQELAEIVGGEATTPSRLIEAARFAGEGGAPDVAKALEAGAQIWEGMLRGDNPLPLLAHLDPVRAAAPRFAILELVRALLLARSGDQEKADAAFASLEGRDPRPSPAFLARAGKERASLALDRGDYDAFDKALSSLPADQAAEKRAERAHALESDGDPLSALSLYRKTAEAGGPPTARAWCDVGRIEEARGRREAAAEAWRKAAAGAASDPFARAILALRDARGADPLGARPALEEASKDPSLDAGLRAEAARVLRGCDRLRGSLEALTGREGETAVDLASSALAAAPDLRPGPAVQAAALALADAPQDEKKTALAVAAALDLAPVTSETRVAVLRARTARLLDAALFDEAVKLAEADRAATLAAIVELAPASLSRLLEQGRVEDAARLFEVLKARGLASEAAELTAHVRSDARYAALWLRDRFVGAAGTPDPLARKAPYVCELTLVDGACLGVVRVVAVDAKGLSVEVPGRAALVRVPRERLSAQSVRGVDDEAFDGAAAATREPVGRE